MSDRYYYLLKGPAAQAAHDFEEKACAQRKALHTYLAERWGVKDGERYRLTRIDNAEYLRGVPVRNPVPPEFKVERNDARFMSPRFSLKAGKAIDKEWRQYPLEWVDLELLKRLCVKPTQLCGGCRLVYPYTVIALGEAYLVSGRLVKHDEALEIPRGTWDEIVEEHNAKIQARKKGQEDATAKSEG